MKSVWIAVTLLLSLVSAGCDEDGGARMSACLAFCSKLETCDDRTDVDGCQRLCQQELAQSDAYVEARSRCATRSSCNVWSDEVGPMGEDLCRGEQCALDDCTSDELAQREPTLAERSYCARVVSKLSACDQASLPASELDCLELVAALSPVYLGEMERCIDADCAQIDACLARVADRFNTDLTLGD